MKHEHVIITVFALTTTWQWICICICISDTHKHNIPLGLSVWFIDPQTKWQSSESKWWNTILCLLFISFHHFISKRIQFLLTYERMSRWLCAVLYCSIAIIYNFICSFYFLSFDSFCFGSFCLFTSLSFSISLCSIPWMTFHFEFHFNYNFIYFIPSFFFLVSFFGVHLITHSTLRFTN